MNSIILTPMFNRLSHFQRHLISYLISPLDVHHQCFIFPVAHLTFINPFLVSHMFHLPIAHLTFINPLLVSHMLHVPSVCFTSMFHHLTEALHASLPFF